MGGDTRQSTASGWCVLHQAGGVPRIIGPFWRRSHAARYADQLRHGGVGVLVLPITRPHLVQPQAQR